MTERDESKTQHPAVVVVYLLRDGRHGPEVLLGEKRRGLGTGRVVGPGGKREGDETAVETAVREVAEEVGLRVDPADLEARGTLDYRFPVPTVLVAGLGRLRLPPLAGGPVGRRRAGPAVGAGRRGPVRRDVGRRALLAAGVLAGGRVEARVVFAEDNASVAGFTGTGIGEPG